MPRILAALVLILAVLAPAPGAQTMNPALGDDPEDEARYLESLELEAAEYRLERADGTVDPAHDARAKISAAKARDAIANRDWKRAHKVARRAFTKFSATASVETAADLKRSHVIAAANLGRIYECRTELARLYLFFPGYGDLGAAMEAALAAAEKAQRFSTIVDLSRDDPREVIDVAGSGQIADNDKLFRFLATYGDRATVGARAKLGLARARLLSSNLRDTAEAREAYEDFLGAYPRHQLTFTGLCELALTHLVTYRGEHYDVGALVNAAAVIDLAEAETRGDAEKAQLVQAYRARIRAWHQDRDLQVARWYRDREHPRLLAWLKKPVADDWDAAARHFYREVVARDPSSPQGRAAERELAELPAPRPGAPAGER